MFILFFFFKQKTAYEMRISDWSSDVCSSDLLDLVLAGRLEHVRAGQHGQHAERLVVLDEAHAAHVRGEHVDLPGALGVLERVVEQGEVRDRVLSVGVDLVPLALGLHVDRADAEALREKIGDKVPADETATACYERSEEHTSELQSLMRNPYAVFCLKKKTRIN